MAELFAYGIAIYSTSYYNSAHAIISMVLFIFRHICVYPLTIAK